MEIIIGLVVLAVVGYFVFFRKPAEVVVESTPYKVEAVNAQPIVAEQATQAVVESIAPAKKPRATAAKKAPVAKKAPAAKKVAVKKPAKKVVKAK